MDDQQGLLRVELPLEIRVHGRGGQGGVTCAKLSALMYSNLGLFAQTFGDYGMERSGAPVRAYTHVDNVPIKNRNKVYVPGHLLILDPSLVGEGILDGVLPGALILLNTQDDLSAFRGAYEQFRFATVDATGIARKHGIGSRAVVIVNTAIVGAYARLVDLPIREIEETYSAMGLHSDIGAAQDASPLCCCKRGMQFTRRTRPRGLGSIRNRCPSHRPDEPHLGHARALENRIVADTVATLSNLARALSRGVSGWKRYSGFSS